jgi:small subunit ribosomal protein S20
VPNIKSAKKRVLVIETKTARNKANRSALKTAVKKANAALDAKDENSAEAVRVAIKKLDQSVSKGLLHKNAVARKKSALARKLNQATAN